MMHRSLSLACLVALASALASCATIVDAGPDMVPVTSTPVGTTPCTVAVPRKGEGVFSFELPGHKTTVLDREKVLRGWIFGNIVFAWFAPAGVVGDLATSSQGKYSTDPIAVTLEPGSPSERVTIAPEA
jgi:predicted small secreted protein